MQPWSNGESAFSVVSFSTRRSSLLCADSAFSIWVFPWSWSCVFFLLGDQDRDFDDLCFKQCDEEWFYSYSTQYLPQFRVMSGFKSDTDIRYTRFFLKRKHRLEYAKWKGSKSSHGNPHRAHIVVHLALCWECWCQMDDNVPMPYRQDGRYTRSNFELSGLWIHHWLHGSYKQGTADHPRRLQLTSNPANRSAVHGQLQRRHRIQKRVQVYNRPRIRHQLV
jgi:hypothetical protein